MWKKGISMLFLIGCMAFSIYTYNNRETFYDGLFAALVQDPLGRSLVEKFFAYIETYHSPWAKEKELSPVLPVGGAGSGFYVNRDYIVTNAHVVHGCRYIRTQGMLGVHKAQWVATDTQEDLAVIKSEQPSGVYAVLQKKHALKIGDEVAVVGYPLGAYNFEKVKVLKRYKRIYTRWGTAAHHSIAVDEIGKHSKLDAGNSGSPALDQKGNVVGIMHAGGEGEGYLLFPFSLQRFLQEQGVSYTVKSLNRVLTDKELELYGAAFMVEVYCALS